MKSLVHPAQEGQDPPLDLDVLRKTLLQAREDADDLDFVIVDLMRRRTQRVWGHVTHAEKHAEARDSLRRALQYALAMLGVSSDTTPR